jgi:hypothetical protein
MSCINYLVLSSIVVAGCATADDQAAPGAEAAAAEAAADDVVGASPGTGTNQETGASTAGSAPIYGPTITKNGTSTATAVPAAQGGPGLRLDGGMESGAYAIATYGATPGSGDATLEATVTPTAGASFVYTLIGAGSSYAKRQLRLERLPGASELQAASANGTVACGTLDDKPTAVTLVFHAASQRFDVLLDGEATQCTGLSTKVQAPVAGFQMMDASNEGYGGEVEFSDLAMH